MTDTTTPRHTATLADAVAAREARMGTAIEDAAKVGHVQTYDGTTRTCTCGSSSTPAPRAVRVMMDAHAREVLSTLSIPTVR